MSIFSEKSLDELASSYAGWLCSMAKFHPLGTVPDREPKEEGLRMAVADWARTGGRRWLVIPECNAIDVDIWGEKSKVFGPAPGAHRPPSFDLMLVDGAQTAVMELKRASVPPINASPKWSEAKKSWNRDRQKLNGVHSIRGNPIDVPTNEFWKVFILLCCAPQGNHFEDFLEHGNQVFNPLVPLSSNLHLGPKWRDTDLCIKLLAWQWE